MTIKTPTFAVALLLACLVFGVSPAWGAEGEGAPQWTISAVSMPTNFPPNDASGENVYRVLITNSGSAQTSGTIVITDTLPAGLPLAPAGVKGLESVAHEPREALSCTGLVCTYSAPVVPGDSLELEIPVETGAAGLEKNVVTVSGGGAPEASQSTLTRISSTPATFGIAPGSANTVLSSDEAGGHADLTTTVAFNTINDEGALAGAPKDTIDDLPPGFAGDLVDTPTCTVAYFSAHNYCPVDTQVGSATLDLSGGGVRSESLTPVYNLEPNPGTTAKLGFYAGRSFGIQGDITLRPGDEGIETSFNDIDQATNALDSVALTIWGVPNDPSHDLLRGLECLPENCEHVGGKEGTAVVPFLTNPTRCSGEQLLAKFKADSWEGEEAEAEPEPGKKGMPFGPLTGCEHLVMAPAMTVDPTSTWAYSATGLDFNLEVPQTFENPYGLATSHLKGAVVTLPEGMTLNPSAASGLGYCTEARLAEEGAAEKTAAEKEKGKGCPEDAKVGSVRVKSPAISEEATGALYLAQPYANPFDSLIALYVVAKIPDRGIIVRSAGKVEPNAITGQLTTTFPDNPQLPFSDFALSFHQSSASPLVTPPACGAYTSTAQFTPWSDLSALIPVDSPPFQILHGVGGGACPSGGAPPFAPQVAAGTTSNVAGSYSQLDLRISRNDGEQEITGFASQLPPGLTANLTGVPFCPEADIALARSLSGVQEEAEPSCPAASEIGHTIAEAGVGSVLVQAPGKLYMAGPFEGAPFSIVSITDAKAGPFDLGTVVVHLPLDINPVTSAVTIPAGAADQIPHIIKGIVVHLRTIRAYIDRTDFTLNPTSCAPMSLAATVIGSGASFSDPVGDVPVTVSDPFQAADCANLAFKPTFTASTPGKTTKRDGAGLTVKLTYPNAPWGTQANVAYTKVQLPLQLPSRLTTLQKACLASIFDANPANCPAASVVGHATAVTPILPVPLTGPAYFVSNAGLEFPELVIVLQGYGVTIDLHGKTFIRKGDHQPRRSKPSPTSPSRASN